MRNLQHLTAIIVVTIIMGLIYVCVQQVYRMNANDPQIQLANDLRDALQQNGGGPFRPGADTVPLERSMAVFTQTYDAQGRSLSSTGYLNARVPLLPKGALEHAGRYGENEVTWQPEPGVRLATVIVRVQHPDVGYIVVGRSFKAVEEREANLGIMVLLCWILCAAVIGMNWLYYIYSARSQNAGLA